MFVIPANAGTQRLEDRQRHWVPAFAGMTISGASNVEEHFNVMKKWLHGFPVDRISRTAVR
jgi:hypothetical protein